MQHHGSHGVATERVTISGVNATPEPADAQVARRMSAQRVRDTGPELALRKTLFARGWRYRIAYPVPGKPRCSIDIAFPRAKVGVFVDGCFWHRCPIHGTEPKSNADWWAAKLDANVERDRSVVQAMNAAGWRVVRVWEHEPLESATLRVENALADALTAATVKVS